MAKKKTPLEEHEKRKLNKANFRQLLGVFRFVLPYKNYFILGLIALFFSSTTLLAFPYVAGKLIDAASGESWIVNDLNLIAMLLVGVLLIQSLFSFARVWLFAQVSEKSMRDVRLSLYGRILRLPMAFFDKNRTGALISRITADVSMLQDTFSVTLAELIRQIITLVVGTLFLILATTKLTLFMLATFPVLVILAMVFGKFIRKLSKKSQQYLAEANVIVEETLQSILTVKAFAGEDYEQKRYRSGLGKVVDTALNAAAYRGAFISFIIFALFGGIVGVMWYGATLVSAGEMSVGDLVSFILYTTFIGGSIAGLGDIYGQLQRAIGASERVLEILEEKPETVKNEGESPAISGDISFEQLTFSYPTRPEVEVLKGLNLDIKAGEKVALVGHSGAGKSTIIQLLLRFYQPQSGQILIDGKPLDNYQLKFFREQVAVVPQEILLFGGSIKENIAYGKPSASEDEIITAAKKANAWSFIQKFPEGLNTLVGERGVKLSGGQRQRIAIARAILKDPAILVLDEATSSLDAASEALVQDALQELMKGRTTLIIAHRLATIRQVDQIYMLRDGQVVESGNHQALWAAGGFYAELVNLQMDEKKES